MHVIQYLFDTATGGTGAPWQVYMICMLIAAPLLVFMRWRDERWMFVRATIAAIVTWFFYYWTIDRYWYLRMLNLPHDATLAEVGAANADGAPKLFVLGCGWLPAGIYVGFWVLLWLLIRARRERQPGPLP